MENFKKWCIENHQLILLEMYENTKNEYESDQIGFSSSRIVNWKCKKCGIEWQESLNKATRKTIKEAKECPYCTHERVSKFYNLFTQYPILEKEWDYEKNLKSITEYHPKSKKVVWWKCENGHSWKSTISDRTRNYKNIENKDKMCPYCNHKKISSTYNLVTEYPNIAKQWNYIKNGSLTPLNISPKSNQKVWWTCEYNPNYIWMDRICNRTALNRKCNICSRKFTISFPARVIYYYLSLYFNDCQMEYKISGNYIVDICIPSYKIIIEYDGWYYHSNGESKNRENKKDIFLKERDFKVIRIKENKEKMDEIIYKENIIEYHLEEEYKNLNELVKKVLVIVGKITNNNIKQNIDFKRDYQKIEDLYYHMRKSNSLAVKYPDLLAEWSKNNDELPDTVNTSSQHKVKWVCPKCSREYEASVYNRIRNKSACPYCSNRKVCETNSLANNFPEIAKEWNYEKNGDLLPENVIKGSGKKVWWKCEYGHEWQTAVYSRTGTKKTKCPICRKNYSL